MQTLKCKKCGSTKLTLKHIEEDTNSSSFFDTILFWFLGMITFGLYFIFYCFAERKRAELGTAYYECENCHFKMNVKSISNEEVAPTKKEEVDEEELQEIRAIGQKPVDITKWKEERQEAVIKRRKKLEEDKKNEKKLKKTSKK